MASKLDNVPPEMLADEYGRFKGREKRAQAALAEIRDEMQRRGLIRATGERFSIAVQESERSSLDQKAMPEPLKKKLLPFRKLTTVTSIKMTKLGTDEDASNDGEDDTE